MEVAVPEPDMSKNIILELPYLFTATVKGYKKRKSDQVLVRENLPVEVPEVSSDEAPVVIDWVQKSLQEQYKMPETPQIQFRMMNDVLYRPVGGRIGMSLDDFKQAVLIRHNTFLRTDTASHPTFPTYSYPALPAVLNSRWRYDTVIPTVFPTWSEFITECRENRSRVISHDQEKIEPSSAAALQDTFIIIDGRMWSNAQVNEPMYCLSLGNPPGLDVSMNRRPLPYVFRFSLLSRDKMIRYAEHLGLDTNSVDEPIVYDPSAIKLDNVTLMAEQAITCLCHDVINRKESWSQEADFLLNRIRTLRNANECLELAEAVEILHAYERLVPLLSHLDAHSDGAVMMHKVAPILKQWREIELVERPGLLDLIQDTMANEESMASISSISL